MRRGESLWSIAEDQLGSAARYVEILDLNSDLLGMRPGFLTPGLVLALPPVEPRAAVISSRDSVPHAPETHHIHTVQSGETLASIAATWLGSSSRYPEILEASSDILQPGGRRLADVDRLEPGWKVAIPPRSSTVQAGIGPAGRVRADTPSWLYPGLDRGGSLLTGALLLLWQAHRRDQRRARRPGRTTAVPPVEVWHTEQAVRLLGGAHSETLHGLDLHLRSCRARCRFEGRQPPEVAAVQLGAPGLVLHLAAPADPPQGWEKAGPHRWLLRRGNPPPSDHTDTPPAYPLLVTLGVAATGDLWLVNADSLTGLTVTGDRQRCADFARHVTLELATSPWSGSVALQSESVGADLAVLRGQSPAPEPFRRVQVTVSDSTTRVVALNARDTRTHRRTQVELTADGVARLPWTQAPVAAVGLSEPEAAACVAVVAQTGSLWDVAVPPATRTGRPWERVMNQAGAALPQYTVARRSTAMNASRTGSLLPLPDSGYLAVTATTAQDLQRVAPYTTTAARATLRAADPELPADLTAWFDPACPAPRLSLLGRVQMNTTGAPLHRGEEYYAELTAFLLLSRHGRSSEEISEAFALDRLRVRNDLLVLREWLGVDPHRQTPYVRSRRPRGDQQLTDAFGAYRVEGVLTDVDLFRRLRLRGQSRGCDGIENLVAALSLVRGRPFSDLPGGGWSWLAREPRLDEDITAAVADVAHIVTTHALSAGDLNLARDANHTARTAAPDDDVARWDEVAIEAARGHAAHVERLVSLVPPQPPALTGAAAARTAEIRTRHGW